MAGRKISKSTPFSVWMWNIHEEANRHCLSLGSQLDGIIISWKTFHSFLPSSHPSNVACPRPADRPNDGCVLSQSNQIIIQVQLLVWWNILFQFPALKEATWLYRWQAIVHIRWWNVINRFKCARLIVKCGQVLNNVEWTWLFWETIKLDRFYLWVHFTVSFSFFSFQAPSFTQVLQLWSSPWTTLN